MSVAIKWRTRAIALSASLVLAGCGGSEVAKTDRVDEVERPRGTESQHEYRLEGPDTTVARLSSAEASESGWVLAGASQASPTGEAQAMLWYSGDGATWAEFGRPGASTPAASTRADRVLHSGDDVLVAGEIVEAGAARLGVWARGADGTWSGPTAVPGSEGLKEVTDLIRTPRGFVIAGASGRPSTVEPSLWTSPDGRSWARPTSYAWSGGQPLSRQPQSVQALAASDDVIVAVGNGDDGTDDVPAIAWWSEDGLTWHQTDVPGAPGGGHDLILDVVWTGAEFFAVGAVDLDAAAWTSVDGRNWTRSSLPALEEGTTLAAVRNVGEGAVGVLGGSALQSHLLLRAANGTWSELVLPQVDPPIGTEPALFAARGNEMVVAHSEHSIQRVWHSPGPGRPWTLADSSRLPGAGTPRSGVVLGLAAGGGTFVAVGAMRTRDGSSGELSASEGRIWYRSGRSWRQAELDVPVDRVEDVLFDGAQFVAVGNRTAQDGWPRAVWLHSSDGVTWTPGSEPGQPASPGEVRAVGRARARLVAVGARPDEAGVPGAAVWTSSDGADWVPSSGLPRSADPSAELRAVCGTQAHLFAVGFQRRNERDEPMVWRSSDDGVTWESLADDPVFDRGRSAMPLACAATREGVVIAGDVGTDRDSERADALFWHSADAGETWTAAEPDRGHEAHGDQILRDVVWTGDTWLAVGHSDDDDFRGDLAAWQSADGRHWMRSVVARGGVGEGTAQGMTVMVLGAELWIGGSDLEHAQLWQMPLP